MTTWLKRLFGGGATSPPVTRSPGPRTTVDDLDARIAKMERELIASSLGNKPNTIQSAVKESQLGKAGKHVFDEKHPLAQVLSSYVMKKRNARFKWPNAVIADAVVDAGYRAQSLSPFLTIMMRQGVVKRTGKSKYEWIGFRIPVAKGAAQPAVTRLPKCPKPIKAESVLQSIASSIDGLTFGQLMLAFPKASYSQMNGALTSLQNKKSIIRIDGRYWAWADLDRRTARLRVHTEQPH